MNHPGVVVFTDGAVKSDGRMGAAYVSLDDRLPARSFVVLGPPSTMRAELSALDQAVADAPADEDRTHGQLDLTAETSEPSAQGLAGGAPRPPWSPVQVLL